MTKPLYVIPGHGHGDPGAGGGGQTEADNVRKLATRIKELAANPNDVVLHPFDRNAYAQGDLNSWKIPTGAQVVELHQDSSGTGTARGAHVIIKDGYSADSFDVALANKLSKILPGRASIIVKRGDLANANRAARRGINYRLAEVGFIDSIADRDTFNSRMDEIARAILEAAGVPAKGAGVATEGWYKDSHGWWYENGDGTYKRSCWWMPKRGEWYCFGADGYAYEGWMQIGGAWYYFAHADESGLKQCQMVAGEWRKDSKGLWYWLSGDGSMAKSRWVDRARYYVGPDGVWDQSR